MISTLTHYRLHNTFSPCHLVSPAQNMLSVNGGADRLTGRKCLTVNLFILFILCNHVGFEILVFVSCSGHTDFNFLSVCALHPKHSATVTNNSAAERVCFCLCVCLIAGLQECTARMCWTPAGLWHFLSVYLTAYPPQDYREKKRKERWQEHPFPSHTLFPHFYNSHTHTQKKKNLNKKCNSLANV